MARHKRKVCPICHGRRKLRGDIVSYQGFPYRTCDECWMDKLMAELKEANKDKSSTWEEDQ